MTPALSCFPTWQLWQVQENTQARCMTSTRVSKSVEVHQDARPGGQPWHSTREVLTAAEAPMQAGTRAAAVLAMAAGTLGYKLTGTAGKRLACWSLGGQWPMGQHKSSGSHSSQKLPAPSGLGRSQDTTAGDQPLSKAHLRTHNWGFDAK